MIHPHQKGVFYLSVSIICATMSNSLIHALSCHYETLTILFYKGLISLFLLWGIHRTLIYQVITSTCTRFHLLRAGVGCLGVFFSVKAFQCLPLTDVSALGLLSSVFGTVGGYIFFKEHSTILKNIVLTLSFLGALIILKPHFESDFYLYSLPVLSALCFAISSLLARFLAVKNEGEVSSFYVFLCLCLSGSVQYHFPTTQLDGFVFLSIGLLYGLSQMCYVKAYAYAQTSYLAPFKFLKIPLHVGSSILFFSHYPSLTSLLGAMILMISLWVLYCKKPVPSSSA